VAPGPAPKRLDPPVLLWGLAFALVFLAGWPGRDRTLLFVSASTRITIWGYMCAGSLPPDLVVYNNIFFLALHSAFVCREPESTNKTPGRPWGKRISSLVPEKTSVVGGLAGSWAEWAVLGQWMAKVNHFPLLIADYSSYSRQRRGCTQFVSRY